jgi:RNA polymerase sigma factor (TIGR02999 family)
MAGPESPESVTELLDASRRGDGAAHERLVAVVYAELKSIAHRELFRFRRNETLSTTALVHEAYVRLLRSGSLPGRDRLHLLAIAAQAMRRLLIDRARERYAEKRGGGADPLPLDATEEIAAQRVSNEILALDAALVHLGERDERLARLVELRFFGGLSEVEVAELLGVTERTVRRDWQKAKGFLYRELAAEGSAGPALPA